MTSISAGQARAGPAVGAAKGRAVPKRLLRVLRQLLTAAAVAVAYYFLTTTLLTRFGQRGFLIALAVLAVVMALRAEFGKDIAAIPKRIRASRQRTRARRRAEREKEAVLGNSAAVGGEVKEPEPSPPAPEPATRQEAEARFREQFARLQGNEIGQEAFQQFLKGFHFIDPQGKFWTIQADTGKWSYYKGGEWRPGVPLGALTRARLPSGQ